MFCKNCGTELKEGTKFCPKCGTPAATTQQMYSGQQQGGGAEGRSLGVLSERKARKAPVFAIGAIVILIIAVVLVIRGCAGGGYEEPIRNLVKGIENQDGKQILKAFSDEMMEAAEEESGYSREEFAEMYENMFNYSIGDVNLFDVDYRIDYEIEDDYDLSEREVKEIEDELSDEGIDVDIKAGKEVELTLEISVKNIDYHEEEDKTVEVIKIGQNWYINPLTF